MPCCKGEEWSKKGRSLSNAPRTKATQPSPSLNSCTWATLLGGVSCTSRRPTQLPGTGQWHVHISERVSPKKKQCKETPLTHRGNQTTTAPQRQPQSKADPRGTARTQRGPAGFHSRAGGKRLSPAGDTATPNQTDLGSRLARIQPRTAGIWPRPVIRASNGMFRIFRSKSGMLWSLFFASSQVFIAFVATRQLCRSAIRTNTPCGVRYVACHVQVALLLSFLGPPWCQWCSDWCALGCSATVAFGCVCSSHVSGWLTSVEVFAAVPLGVSCFLSCWVGGYFVARWNVGAQAGCFIAAFGACRRVMRARLVFWCANAIDRNRHFLVFSK